MSAGPEPAWATDGIAPMERPGWASRLFMRVVALAESLNRRQAILGNRRIFDTTDFPWAAELERDWRSVRAELDVVMARKRELPNVQDITVDAASINDDDRWKVFVFTAYGVRSPRNCARCPETWRLVQRIPGLQTAMFSVFEPGKHTPPHRGPYNGVLRLHLGLVVPEPRERSAIRIDQALQHWEEGRTLIFDDAYEHEAWNHTAQSRVVLFVDFVKPLRFPARALNALMLRLAVFTPFLREGEANLRRWEERFYR